MQKGVRKNFQIEQHPFCTAVRESVDFAVLFYGWASFGSDDIVNLILSLLVIIISLLTMLSDLKDAPSTVKSTDF